MCWDQVGVGISSADKPSPWSREGSKRLCRKTTADLSEDPSQPIRSHRSLCASPRCAPTVKETFLLTLIPNSKGSRHSLNPKKSSPRLPPAPENCCPSRGQGQLSNTECRTKTSSWCLKVKIQRGDRWVPRAVSL